VEYYGGLESEFAVDLYTFRSRLRRELRQLTGIKHSLSDAYHAKRLRECVITVVGWRGREAAL